MRFPFRTIPERKPGLVDIVVMIFILGIISLAISIASGWNREGYEFEINLNPIYLPWYSAQSIFRMCVAYILSLTFSIWYGYTASKSRLHSSIMIPLLDIMQSIPVLSFMPAFTLAMINLFPGKRLGVELASIFLIFTGQVWNLTFSYYHSISTIPRELKEVAYVFGFNKFSKFLRIDLPYSIIGLIWNSMMSVAGGWFFLMACEMFTLGDKSFRLPGIGSYIQVAAMKGSIKHVLYGIATMIITIVVLDFIVWQPLVIWSQRFKYEKINEETEIKSYIYELLGKSKLAHIIGESIYFMITKIERFSYKVGKHKKKVERTDAITVVLRVVISTVFAISVGFIISKLYIAIEAIRELSYTHYITLLKATLFSLLRVIISILIALIWTLPVGVFIGMNPQVAARLQSIVQILSSIPATAIFPIIVLIVIKLNLPIDIASISLMLLGTQWYLLFNIIAGASSIPKDLIEVYKLFEIKGFKKWKTLIIPAISPYLLTGLITASGGAWNATIVSEYINYHGKTMKTLGLGAIITESAESADFKMLFLSTATMALVVVTINTFVWKRLFKIIKTKFILEE